MKKLNKIKTLIYILCFLLISLNVFSQREIKEIEIYYTKRGVQIKGEFNVSESSFFSQMSFDSLNFRTIGFYLFGHVVITSSDTLSEFSKSMAIYNFKEDECFYEVDVRKIIYVKFKDNDEKITLLLDNMNRVCYNNKYFYSKNIALMNFLYKYVPDILLKLPDPVPPSLR